MLTKAMTENHLTAREAAVRLLLLVYQENLFSGDACARVLPKLPDKKERALATRLFEGCLEREIELSYLIGLYSKTPVKKMKPAILCILLITFYQLKYMDKIPASAACNEAVKLAKRFSFAGLSGFVNAVARAFQRSLLFEEGSVKIVLPAKEKNLTQYLSVCYSMPPTIVELLIRQYGADTTEQLLAAFLEERNAFSIRVNTSSTDIEHLRNALLEAGCEVSNARYVSDALLVTGMETCLSLPEFSEGAFYVQDESSMQAVLAAGLRGGERVLDLCAAPGGKACMAADILMQKGAGSVDARDCSESKQSLLKANIKRLLLTNITAKQSDATIFCPEDQESFDVVLADVPCSGLGILSKKPDIKHFFSGRELQSLIDLQHRILRNGARYVKKGGVLIFSTCTLNEEENLSGFEYLRTECGLVPESLDPYVSEKLWSETTKQGSLLMLPHLHGTDGFFVARFRKEG